jgi:hypothetical protein
VARARLAEWRRGVQRGLFLSPGQSR